MLVGDETPSPARIPLDRLRQIQSQQPSWVPGERSVLPHRIVHANPDKPAKQQVSPICSISMRSEEDGVEHLQRQLERRPTSGVTDRSKSHTTRRTPGSAYAGQRPLSCALRATDDPKVPSALTKHRWISRSHTPDELANEGVYSAVRVQSVSATIDSPVHSLTLAEIFIHKKTSNVMKTA